MTGKPQRPADKLPAWRTAADAYRSVFVDDVGNLPRAMITPVILFFVTGLVLSLLNLEISPDDFVGSGDQVMFRSIPMFILKIGVGTLVYLAVSVVFLVAWHRLVLFGPDIGRPDPLSVWSMAHWRYLGWSIVIIALGVAIYICIPILGFVIEYLLLSISGGTFVAILNIAIGIAALIGMILIPPVIMLKLALVLPAAAIGQRLTFRDAWRCSRGQGGRLFGGCLLILLPFIALVLLMFLVFGFDSDPQDMRSYGDLLQFDAAALVTFLTSMATAILTFLWLGLLASFLSWAFRFCTGWRPDSGGGQGAYPQRPTA